MFKLIFTNSIGQSVELFGAPYRLFKVEGIGDVEADVQSQKAPYQDGDTFIDSVLEPRYIAVELKITGKTREELSTNRKKLAAVFNPKLGLGVLQYVNGNEIRVIRALAESVPVFPDGSTNRGSTFQKTVIHLKAPNPFWLDVLESNEPLTAWLGLLKFPFKFPVQFGKRADRATITNEGDVSTPVVIEFRGPATNPKVMNETTGEFIKVNRILKAGDVLEVNTAFGNKRVEIVAPDGTRTNVFNYIDLDSKFFSLITGENEISFSSDDPNNNAAVAIRYKKRYVGI